MGYDRFKQKFLPPVSGHPAQSVSGASLLLSHKIGLPIWTLRDCPAIECVTTEEHSAGFCFENAVIALAVLVVWRRPIFGFRHGLYHGLTRASKER
jgi:hypothetical protein